LFEEYIFQLFLKSWDVSIGNIAPVKGEKHQKHFELKTTLSTD